MLTTLDPQTALVVIDLQKGMLRPELTDSLLDIARKTRLLADEFRVRGLPVVWVTVAGGASGRTEQARTVSHFPATALELLDELGAQVTDLHLQKHTWGAFTRTTLEQSLLERGITGVVLCGVATSIGVESTARQAFELGFNVTLVTDAMTDMRPEAHQNSLAHIFPRLGETGTTQELLKLLSQR